jgi:hypothetical protein
MPLPKEIPISKHFSEERIAEIDHYWYHRLDTMVKGLTTIREEKYAQWRKIYNGTPRQKEKDFPWQGASNIVIQLVGSYVDQLTAKIVMATVAEDPLWVAGILGEWKRSEKSEEQRAAIQEHLIFSGLEPSFLNLMEKYPIWIRTIIKYGLGTMKLLPELVKEQVVESETSSGVDFTDYIRRDGPVALPLLFDDFIIPSTQKELDRYPMVGQRAKLQKFEVESFLYDRSFKKSAVKAVLQQPDRQGPDKVEQEIESDSGAKTEPGGHLSDRWDIYECYFPYMINGKRFHLIYTGHLKSKIPMKRVFNWLPENSIPYVTGRLGSDGERAYGFGFCEMLKDYQEEVTAIHNRRGDASTLANTNLLRAGSGSQLDANFSIYPNALVTGEEGSIEVIPLGRTANETIKDEQQTLQLATDRAGVGPSASGSGSGTVTKKGQYTAMGSFPIMQEGNTRANLNITEFRTSHYTLGRLKLLYDAHFGLRDSYYQLFGEREKYLRKALENVRNGRIYLPIRAATGSVNKEIEKQNLMLLLNNLRAHGQQMAQLLQATANPMAPPDLQHFLLSFAQSSTYVMRKICKEFGIEDPSVAVPSLLETIEDRIAQIENQVKQQKQAQQQQPQLPGGGGPPQLPGPGGTSGSTGEAPGVQPGAQQMLREELPNDRAQ